MSGQPPPPGSTTDPPKPAGRARGRSEAAAVPVPQGQGQGPPPPSPGPGRPPVVGQPPVGARPGPPAARPGPSGARPGPPGARPGPPGARPGPPGAPVGVGRAGPPAAGASASGRGTRPGPTAPPQGGPPSGRSAPPARPGPPGPGSLAAPGRAIHRGGAEVAATMAGLSVSSAVSASTTPSTSGSGPTGGASGGATGTGSGGSGGSVQPGVGRGVRRREQYVLTTKPETLPTKIGEGGIPFDCITNYYKLKQKPGWKLFQYRVDFLPEEDDTKAKKLMIRTQKERLGNFIFDGTVLYGLTRYTPNSEKFILTCENAISGSSHKVTIRSVGELDYTDYNYIQFCNILLRKCMEGLDLQELGRNYFDPTEAISLKEYKLELWPGYVTSIRQHERDLLLCCEISNKILRTDTVRDQIIAAYQKDKTNYRSVAQRLLLGCIVITRYNNKTYKIDDISWEETPMKTFPSKGQSVTYVQYYKERYGLAIKDMQQPLIVSNPNARMRRSGITEPIKLIPELCNMTGLSDEQRANFKLMKAVGDYTRTAPIPRIAALQKFAKRLVSSPKVNDELKDWNMKFSGELERVQGRTFAPEKIMQGQNKVCSYQMDNADWGSARDFKLFGSVNCAKWVVIYSERDSKVSKEFIQCLGKVSIGMGFMLGKPKEFQIGNTRPATYIEQLKKSLELAPHMVMVVIPNNKSDAYHAIKKICCIDNPVPSQVMTGQVLNKPKGMMSVAGKVAIQMAAKMGGEPWGVQMPVIDGLMVIGYDSWHDGTQKGMSVGAVVSSINKTLTRYTSTCTFHRNNEELLDQLRGCIAAAVRKYFEANNKAWPKRVVVYRDGVGDGQIEYVKEQEIAMIKKVFVENNFEPTFTYIIVSKRINSRFFKMDRQGPVNPPSGSIIDDVVTLPERYDFFLISQSVRQGTVNPTSYNVIEDSSKWPAKNLQSLTYKLTHLYFNWPGTVRVPSVCQYAHKLAYLLGESLHRRPSEQLDTQLFYL